MLFKGNLTSGLDVVVECSAAISNQSPVLVTVAEVPRGGQQPRVAHRLIAPGGSDQATLPGLSGIALRVDIDVVEPETVTVRVIQGTTVMADVSVSQDEKWIFSAAT